MMINWVLIYVYIKSANIKSISYSLNYPFHNWINVWNICDMEYFTVYGKAIRKAAIKKITII